jgi:membrane protease YdiL (CAAX protease family)
MTAKKRLPVKAIFIYCLLFYSCWALFEWYGRYSIEKMAGNEWLSQVINSGIIKNCIWTLPALFLINHYKSLVYVKADQIFRSKVQWSKYLPIYVAFAIYLVGRDFALTHSFAISSNFEMTQLINVLFVGITEEMVFRGWLLNVTISESCPWRAILINAFLFLLVHFPRWLYEGCFISSFTSLGFVSIMILSMIFSWTFFKSKNIIVPITLHMFWDLLAFLFS